MSEPLLQKAKNEAPNVFVELEHCEKLLTQGYFTEAGLRLGRATEATLYFLAADAGILLTDKTVLLLKNLRDNIEHREIEILRGGTPHEVRQLADVSKKLSEAIHHLTEHESSRRGEPLDTPKRPDAILREILSLPTLNVAIKKRLGLMTPLVREILDRRNDAAHADIGLGLREICERDVIIMRENVYDFIDTMLDAALGLRSQKAIEKVKKEA